MAAMNHRGTRFLTFGKLLGCTFMIALILTIFYLPENTLAVEGENVLNFPELSVDEEHVDIGSENLNEVKTGQEGRQLGNFFKKQNYAPNPVACDVFTEGKEAPIQYRSEPVSETGKTSTWGSKFSGFGWKQATITVDQRKQEAKLQLQEPLPDNSGKEVVTSSCKHVKKRRATKLFQQQHMTCCTATEAYNICTYSTDPDKNAELIQCLGFLSSKQLGEDGNPKVDDSKDAFFRKSAFEKEKEKKEKKVVKKEYKGLSEIKEERSKSLGAAEGNTITHEKVEERSKSLGATAKPSTTKKPKPVNNKDREVKPVDLNTAKTTTVKNELNPDNVDNSKKEIFYDPENNENKQEAAKLKNPVDNTHANTKQKNNGHSKDVEEKNEINLKENLVNNTPQKEDDLDNADNTDKLGGVGSEKNEEKKNNEDDLIEPVDTQVIDNKDNTNKGENNDQNKLNNEVVEVNNEDKKEDTNNNDGTQNTYKQQVGKYIRKTYDGGKYTKDAIVDGVKGIVNKLSWKKNNDEKNNDGGNTITDKDGADSSKDKLVDNTKQLRESSENDKNDGVNVGEVEKV